MTETIELKERKDTGTSDARRTRLAGDVPGVIYGDQIPTRHFTVPAAAFKKLYETVGSSSLFDVKVPGEEKPVKAIVHEVAKHPVNGNLLHVDLYQVRMDRKLHTEIPLEFAGVSSAVKDLGGVLTRQIDQLPVACLPGDLVPHIEISIATLKAFDDAIRVKDLNLPAGMETRLDPEDIIISVLAPRSEEEIAELESAIGDVEKVEVVGKGKEDEATEAGEGEKADEKKEG